MIASAASLWEIAIQKALGKLDAPDDLPAQLAEKGIATLPVSPDHAWHVRHLPRLHDDPFDRMPVAQAQLEGLGVVTADPAFAGTAWRC